MRRSVLALGWCVACAGSGTSSHSVKPAERRAPVAATPSAAAAPAAAAPAEQGDRKDCLPPNVRAEGRVDAGERTDSGEIAFCIRTVLTQKCLGLDPATGVFRAHDEIARGFRFAPSGIEPAAGSAVRASNAGSVEVCASAERCATVRIRPPVRDAFDELFGSLPAVAISDDRVVVARLEQKFLATEMKIAAWLDLYSVGKKQRVASARVGPGFVTEPLVRVGRFVYFELCHDSEDPSCSAYLANPQTLASQKLALTRVHLPPERTRIEPDESIQRIERTGDSYAIVDARGNELITVSGTDGRVLRRTTIGPASDLAIAPARAGRLDDARLVVIRSAPHAGSVSIVALGDGSAQTFEPPICE